MLGAPFWFDLLNKVMVIRSTVKPHEKSPEESSEDRRPGEIRWFISIAPWSSPHTEAPASRAPAPPVASTPRPRSHHVDACDVGRNDVPHPTMSCRRRREASPDMARAHLVSGCAQGAGLKSRSFRLGVARRRRLGRILGVICHYTAKPDARATCRLRNADPRPRGSPRSARQLGLGRDGTFYVIAAGRANHAGEASGTGSRPAIRTSSASRRSTPA